MSVAVDSEMSLNAGAGGANITSLTFSFTNTAGTFIVVGVGIDGQWTPVGNANGGFPTVTATYAGASLTESLTNTDKEVGASDYYARVSQFTKKTPATGTNNVVLTGTFGASPTYTHILGGAISTTGEHATTPIGNTVKSTSPTGTTNTTGALTISSSTGNLIVDMMTTGDPIQSNNQTLSWKKEVDFQTTAGEGYSQRAAGAASVTMSYTLFAGGDSYDMIAMEIVAAGGGPTGRLISLSLTGVGA